jgi:hypothetical protein
VDENDKLIDEVLVRCIIKDEKGTCLKESRISAKTDYEEEILMAPTYN